jgi:phage host-nuclease inhibitor protein Gam
MAVTRISDNREFESATVAEADKKFEELAHLEIGIKAKKAMAEKKIADIKSKLAAQVDDVVDEYNELLKWLNGYILANKDRFAKPRMRKTEFGKYGLRTATKLNISDEQKVIESSDRLGLALYETKKSIIKKAVERAIADGKKISGAKIISGDIAGFNVSKELLEAELKR